MAITGFNYPSRKMSRDSAAVARKQVRGPGPRMQAQFPGRPTKATNNQLGINQQKNAQFPPHRQQAKTPTPTKGFKSAGRPAGISGKMSGAGTPDFFYREALRLGYLARSAFKLLQMQNKYKLITPGSAVLDLGCAPGAWLQVACQSLGPLKNGGAVVGIDLKNVKVPTTYCDSRVQTVSADVLSLSKQQIKELSPKQRGFKVVLSDMCPLVSGITSRDAALSTELGMGALGVAVGRAALGDTVADDNDDDDGGVLQIGGSLIIKLLESEDVQEFNRICKPLFRKTSWLRPKATRPSSREIYMICQNLQKPT